ncbi:MAG: hypothetical protein MJZ66_03830 [Bacteroidales bacterium]|nr:hypothetical protein [Bacteroidales bacterium]
MEILNNLAQILMYNPEEPLIFSSGKFLLLFIIFYAIYNTIVNKNRKLVAAYVVAFSLFFYYKSSGEYLILLILTTLLDYLIGNKIHQNSENKRAQKAWLVLGIVPSLLTLAYFKYTNFIILNIDQITGSNFAFQEIFLPVGISFYTFQSISYMIDIYWKRVSPAQNILDFAFYLTFFPQLVAGPIVKANLFLPQLQKENTVDKTMAHTGLWLIIIGLFKKAVIADYIAQYNDLIFQAPQTYNGLENLMAVLGYALQIFCDFSGYSDMAIGIGKVMGFDLGINFRSPYKSLTVTEFWKRWHISLSSWLQEYLYIPLGGNRESSLFSVISVPLMLTLTSAILCPAGWITLAIAITGVMGVLAYRNGHQILMVATLATGTVISVLSFSYSITVSMAVAAVVIIWVLCVAFPQISRSVKTNLNLLLTMLIGGLWHGAAWKFVLWGGAHGVALGIDKAVRKVLPENGFTKFLTWICTFCLVVVLWMFFRAQDITVDTENGIENLAAFDVPFVMLGKIFNDFDITFFQHFWDARMLWTVLVAFGFACHAVPEAWAQKIQNWFVDCHIIIKIVVLILVMQMVVQLQSETVQPFIYFQF